MTRDAIVLIMLLVRIVVAVRLFQLAARKVRSLYWLGAAFLANAAYYALGLLIEDPVPQHFVYTIGLACAQLLVVMFIHTTFYQGKKSPFQIFLGLTIVAAIVDIVSGIWAGPVVSLVSLMVTANWGWHAVIAYQAYQQVAGEKYVEDWVKVRYKLMIAYCALLAMTGLMLVGYLVQDVMVQVQSLLGLFALAGVVLQFLVWVMPERFRQFLNRNYQAELLEEQQEVV